MSVLRVNYSAPVSTWRNSFVAVPLAVLGGVLGLASLFGEWSRVVLRDGSTEPAWTFLSLTQASRGIFGVPYVLALTAMLVMVVEALFGRHRQGGMGLRVGGLALAGLSLMLLGCVAGSSGGDGFWLPYRAPGSSYDQHQVLGWGICAAFGAFTALGAALVVSFPAYGRLEAIAAEPRVE